MPTGYTCIIEDKDATFEEYVWRCARAFGALVGMRDDPLDAALPEKLPVSDYYPKALAAAVAEQARLAAMTESEAESLAAEDYKRALQSWEESEQNRSALVARYDAMAEKVRAWTPPTPDHDELKRFMLEQIRISVEFSREPRAAPPKATAAEWLRAQRESAAFDVTFYTKQASDEAKRAASRQAWLDALRASVPVPAAKGEG